METIKKKFKKCGTSSKPLPDNYNTSRQQSPYRTIAEDLQIEEIFEISHKIDIVGQTVKTINNEVNIQDQTQTEVTTQIIIEIVLIQTLEVDIIQTTVPEIPHINEAGTTQTISIDNTQIIDHETIQTTDQTIIIITIDHVTLPRTEILIIQIDKKLFSVTT